MLRISVVFLLLIMSTADSAAADASVEPSLADAQHAYAADRYADSAAILEKMKISQPDCSECAHLLGRAYGQLAELARWTEAIGYAKKTRLALENAVALDPDNTDALVDLIRFYRSAPGFVGGDDSKAEQLQRRLNHLLETKTSLGRLILRGA